VWTPDHTLNPTVRHASHVCAGQDHTVDHTDHTHGTTRTHPPLGGEGCVQCSPDRDRSRR